MGMERVKEDFLDVAFDILISVHTATPLRGADMNPVCGTIAGAGEALRVDKGFEQERFHAISVKPIVRELLGGERKDFAGKLGNLNPRKDEESAVIDDLREVVFANLIAPPDPAISGGNFQGRAREKQAGNNPV